MANWAELSVAGEVRTVDVVVSIRVSAVGSNAARKSKAVQFGDGHQWNLGHGMSV